MDTNEIFKDMTVEQFMAIKEKMDEAENDTTPFAIVDDEQTVNVIGDVSKTEIEKHDYTVIFYYPNKPRFKEMLDKEKADIIKTTPNYLVFKRTYKDVWVPPRIYTAVQTSVAEVYQFFTAATEDGELRDLTEEESIEVLRMLGQDMIERMCHAVATILRIPEWEEECMYSIAIPPLIMQLVQDFPEIINGVDFFTDRSSENPALTVVE